MRARSHGLDPEVLHVAGTDVPADGLGVEFLRLVARAEELGLDPEQEARTALRALEERVRAAESRP